MSTKPKRSRKSRGKKKSDTIVVNLDDPDCFDDRPQREDFGIAVDHQNSVNKIEPEQDEVKDNFAVKFEAAPDQEESEFNLPSTSAVIVEKYDPDRSQSAESHLDNTGYQYDVVKFEPHDEIDVNDDVESENLPSCSNNLAERTITIDRTKLCRLCMKSFPNVNLRVRHERAHTAIVPFICNFNGCTARFYVENKRRAHVIKDHRATKYTMPNFVTGDFEELKRIEKRFLKLVEDQNWLRDNDMLPKEVSDRIAENIHHITNPRRRRRVRRETHKSVVIEKTRVCHVPIRSRSGTTTSPSRWAKKRKRKAIDTLRRSLTAKYKCHQCAASFASYVSYTQHTRTHPRHKCNDCQKSFAWHHRCSKSLKKKSTYSLSMSSNDVKPATTVKRLREKRIRKYKCLLCSYSTSCKKDFLSHQAGHRGARQFKCCMCTFTHDTEAYIVHHERACHGIRTVLKYPCHTCEYVGDSAVALSIHRRTEFVADRTKFKSKSTKCSECSYQSSTPYLLATHMMGHTGEFEFKCRACTYSHSSGTTLRTHETTCHGLERKYRCRSCPYVANGQRRLAQHMVGHNRERLIQCRACVYSHSRRRLVARHEAQLHGLAPVELAHKCVACPYGTNWVRLLQKHMIGHSTERQFHCRSCTFTHRTKMCVSRHERRWHNAKFSGSSQRGDVDRTTVKMRTVRDDKKNHFLSHRRRISPKCHYCAQRKKRGAIETLRRSQTAKYKCRQCAASFANYVSYTQHTRTHPRHKCRRCLKLFAWHHRCFARINKIKQHKSEKSSANTEKTNLYKCLYCPFAAKETHRLIVHQSLGHRRARQFKCCQCSFSADKAMVIFYHERKCHGILSVLKYPCPACSLSFDTVSALGKHRIIHTDGDEKYKCTDCSFTTWSTRVMADHRRRHAIDLNDETSHQRHLPVAREHQCPDCPYTASFHEGLINHIESHTIERQFKCRVCTYSQKTRGSVSSHERVWHGLVALKHHSCPECPYTTNNPKALEEHMTGHTFARQFKCRACSYSQSTRKAVSMHESRWHHLEPVKDNHLCALCPYKCRSARYLRMHMTGHTNKRRFKCRSCTYSHNERYFIDLHEKYWHDLSATERPPWRERGGKVKDTASMTGSESASEMSEHGIQEASSSSRRSEEDGIGKVKVVCEMISDGEE